VLRVRREGARPRDLERLADVLLDGVRRPRSRAYLASLRYNGGMAATDYLDVRRMRLDVEFQFAAAHRLPRYDGPCFRLHGHNYRFFVGLTGDVDPKSGMIADFGEVKRIVQELVLSRVDHRNLNDTLENPTAENIARWIWETLEGKLPGLCEVRLYEIPDSCVTYRGPGAR
jgi:6-pyruvoyltetrahydropterin/6-carboxytetrahydropterin synthase